MNEKSVSRVEGWLSVSLMKNLTLAPWYIHHRNTTATNSVGLTNILRPLLTMASQSPDKIDATLD